MLRHASIAFAGLCLFAACSSGPKASDPKAGATLNPTVGPVTITLWHTYREAEQKALDAVVEEWNQSPEGKTITVRVEANPYDGFADKLSASIPRGNGPDLFIFAHDRIGGWAKSKLLEPLQEYVTEDLTNSFWPETLPPLEFQDQFYGLPLAYKSAVLFYNTDMIPTPPKTTTEMIEMAKANTKTDEKVFGLLYPHSSLFHHSPWLFGFGGKLLADTGKPDLDTPENLASINFVKGLIDAGIIPKEVNASDLASFFNAKKAAMVINGPWFRGELAPDLKYAVAPLPTIAETSQPAKPFLTVEAVMLSAQGAHKKEAFAFARFLAAQGAKTRMITGKQSVSAKAAYELPEAKSDAVLQVFLAQLHASTPTPNIPEMNAIWSPFDKALEAALSGRLDAKAALQEAQTKALGQ